MSFLWAIPAAIVIAVLLIKIRRMQKSADEISAAFSERLETETNTLVDISSQDRHMRALAGGLNGQLRMLREQRHRYQQGDAELKNAVTGISHDLRTPLTAISGYLELLEKEKDPQKAEKYIAIIKNRAEVLTKLSEELFKYSVDAAAEQELRLESVSVNACLEESLAAFYTALSGREIEPEIEIPETPVVRTLDKAALSRVFANILSNAVKYSGGDLKIILTKEGVISFENSAPGLDGIQTERLFERFYTVESARKSTGLGLSIAKVLTERMGGGINAKYSAGRLSIYLRF